MKILVLASLVLLTACGGGDGAPAATPIFQVTYEVTGSTPSASVTYRSGSGSTQQEVIKVPGTVPGGPIASAFPLTFKQGDFLYLSAQKQGSSGSVTVTMKTNGRIISSATSTAPYGIATASATCC